MQLDGYLLTSFPLLRTAGVELTDWGYKHFTPAGVQDAFAVSWKLNIEFSPTSAADGV